MLIKRIVFYSQKVNYYRHYYNSKQIIWQRKRRVYAGLTVFLIDATVKLPIVEQNAGYSVGGVNVKKHAYIVKIKNKKYYTAHGCFFLSLGKRKVGKEISVFKNEKYGNEVFKCFDFRIEVVALLVFLFGVFIIYSGLR